MTTKYESIQETDFVIHPLEDCQFCPNCNGRLNIDQNIILKETNLCIWKCQKCWIRLIEVLLIKEEVQEGDTLEITNQRN